MPVCDGHEASRRIRSWERSAAAGAGGGGGAARERLFIVGLSALAADCDHAEAAESGMDAYLTKPVTPAALRALLVGRRLLE